MTTIKQFLLAGLDAAREAISALPDEGTTAPAPDQTPAPGSDPTPSPSLEGVEVAAPAANAAVSGQTTVKGVCSADIANVAVWNGAGDKISGDFTPVGGEFAVVVDGSKLTNGADELVVNGFTAPAGGLDGKVYQVRVPVQVSGGRDPAPAPYASMKMIFEDHFEGSALDTDRWYCGGKPNSTQTQYGEQYSDAFLVPAGHEKFAEVYRVADSVLTLRAVKDAAFKDPIGWNRTWYAGQIASMFPDFRSPAHFRRGAIEIRAKFPLGAGNGPWPGFWMLNNGSVDKSNGDRGAIELDIEAYGFPHNFNPTVHDWHPGGQDGDGKTGNIALPFDMTTGFHRYCIQLTDAEMIVFADDKEYWRRPLPTSWPDDHFFVLLDMAMGGGWPISGSEYELQIDYVRVYEAA